MAYHKLMYVKHQTRLKIQEDLEKCKRRTAGRIIFSLMWA
jgi:hypothetical protein